MEIPCPACGKKNNIMDNTAPIRCQHCHKEITSENHADKNKMSDDSLAYLVVAETIISRERESEELPSTQMQAGKIKYGRYQIVKEIGHGGMGRVYMAKDPQLERTVALKVLLSGEQAKNSEIIRFLREVKAMANLDHPNIISIHDIGDEGEPFFAMDYIEGQTLKDVMLSRPLAIEEIVEIMIKISNGVEYAHRRGVVHRDLKPGNIIIDKDNTPKIMDFGLAKLFKDEDEISHTGMVMGTLHYMPPEQAKGLRAVDERSDVYALGAMLYELLSGKPPFHGDTHFQMIHQIMSQTPDSIICNKSEIPSQLEKICFKVLEKEKDNRYQSAGKFAEALSGFLQGKNVDSSSLSKQKWFIMTIFVVLAIALGYFFGNRRPVSLKNSEIDSQKSVETAKKNPEKEVPENWPQDLWNKCWNGQWFDFTQEQWLKLPLESQIKYASSYQVWYAKKMGAEIEKIIKIGDSEKYVLRLIPPGRFWMGSPEQETFRNDDEMRHQVLISEAYWMGKYEVSIGQWQNVMKSMPYIYRGENRQLPIRRIDWEKCLEFLNKSKSLCPSEEQWEYACRAGTTTAYHLGKNIHTDQVNYNGQNPDRIRTQTNRGRMVAVGSLPNANSWGLYDMHGNVQEWTRSDYVPYPKDGKFLPTSGKNKTTRGGSAYSMECYCRSACRLESGVDYSGSNLGFRIMLLFTKK